MSSPDSFFQSQNAPKSDPAGGAYDAFPNPPSRLGRGIPPPHSPARSTPSASRSNSVLRPPQDKILATPVRWAALRRLQELQK